MSWMSGFFDRKSKSGTKASRRPIVVRLERLEDRLAPVVGAYAVPAAIAPLVLFQPASPYDGVVQRGGGSGSLIARGTGWSRGHHILTAGHGINLGGAVAVVFDLQREGIPVRVPIIVPANVPSGAQYQIRHSAYAYPLNDIGLALLVDQVNPAPNRLLVAPFTAQQYALYGDAGPVLPEVDQQFTMVGYGMTGTGATGQNMASGSKRVGQNRFDATGAPYNPAYTMYLMADFDRLNDPLGLPNIDPIGTLYAIANPGLGAAEALGGSGDSGSPAFVGANVIAGVFSSGIGPAATDITGGPSDASFGELSFYTNVRRTIGDAALQNVLNPGGGAKYHLVLDMNQQVLGQATDVAGNPLPIENITITAQRNGAYLELIVGGSAAANLNGTYYSAPIANIQSLTIRGGRNHETIQIIGNLWQGEPAAVRPITIHGGAGNDTIILGAGGGGSLSDYPGNVVVDGGGAAETNTLVVNDVAAAAGRTYTLDGTTLGWGAATNLTFTLFQNLTLNAGNGGNNVINVQATNLNTTNTIKTGANADLVNVGSSNDNTSTINNILGDLTVTGSALATPTLNVNDNGSALAAIQTYTVTSSTVQRTGTAVVNYSFLRGVTLNAGTGNDIINFRATAGLLGVFGGPVTMNAGAGNDTINVGSTTNTLDDIRYDSTVNGGDGSDIVNINDQGVTEGKTYDLTSTRPF